MASFPQSEISICNKCDKCVGRCSWSKNLVPVDEWIAEKVEYKLHKGKWGKYKTGVSYRVYWCPQFEELEKRDDNEWKKRVRHKCSLNV